jgi:hypothetical protein
MKEKSRIVFSIPNIKFFVLNTKFKYMDHEFILKDKGKYLEISDREKWFNNQKERWHTPTVKYPTQLFRVWNSENPLCQWDLEHIAIYQSEGYTFYSIDMSKNIRVKSDE